MTGRAQGPWSSYLRRDPGNGTRYEVLATHLETFLARGADDPATVGFAGPRGARVASLPPLWGPGRGSIGSDCLSPRKKLKPGHGSYEKDDIVSYIMVARPQAQSTATKVLRRIRSKGRGQVFVPKDLLDLGSRGAVDAALHRLVDAKKIRHLGRGVYDYPKCHDRLGPLTPSADDLARAVARSTGETLAYSGATAANMLGLSTQVPARPVYLTNGSSRNVQFGNRIIRLVRAAPSRMVGGDTMPGLVLRALRFLRIGGIDGRAIVQLRSILSDADRRGLRKLWPDAPDWMRSILDKVLDTHNNSSGTAGLQGAATNGNGALTQRAVQPG